MNFKSIYFPEIAISRRLRYIKIILVLGMLTALAVSYREWMQHTGVPFIAALENLHPIAEKIIFGIFAFLPLCILFSRKPTLFIVLFMLISTFMVLADRSRLQPWFYQYLIMFFVLAFYNWRVDEPKRYTPVLNALKLCLVLIYVWGGITKLNNGFAQNSWPWMVSSWNGVLTPVQVQFMHKVGYVIPFAEIIGALALLLPTVKRIAIPLLIITHLLYLLVMGPLGQNINPVLWPYHIGMAFLLYFLFAGKAESKFHQWSFTFQFKPTLLVVILLGILPAFTLTKNKAEVVTEKEKNAFILPLISQNLHTDTPVGLAVMNPYK